MRAYDNDIPEFIDCSTMARLMGISRTRLYQLIKAQIILHPVYLIANRRPVYTRDMALHNLEVKAKNVGINNQVIMFYSRKNNTPVPKPKAAPVRKLREREIAPSPSKNHTDLIETLEALGLDGITTEKIDLAIQKCFPEGTAAINDDEILRSVFRYLKCSEPRT